MRNLCDKASEIVRFLTATILEYSDVNSCLKGGIEDPQPKSDNSTLQATKYKNILNKNPSYRFLRSVKIKTKIDFLIKFGQSEDMSKI
jgi:hypothetical protein